MIDWWDILLDDDILEPILTLIFVGGYLTLSWIQDIFKRRREYKKFLENMDEDD